jgi:regulatory protein
MIKENRFSSAISRAMRLCSRREYCISDIKNKLLAWGVPDNETEKIIQCLVKENFINEGRYSEAFVKDKFNHNKWGRIKIVSHLKAKSIPTDLIERALEHINEDFYRNRIRESLSEHRKKIKARNQFDLKGKLYRYGLSKGFESNLLYDILNNDV